MSAAKVLACPFCGALVDLADSRFVCRHCGAEMSLDDHGDEVWRKDERAPGALEEVAA